MDDLKVGYRILIVYKYQNSLSQLLENEEYNLDT